MVSSWAGSALPSPRWLPGAHQASFSSQVKRSWRSLSSSLWTQWSQVSSASSEGLSAQVPWQCPVLTAEQWPVCLPHRCETGSDGLTVGVGAEFQPGLDCSVWSLAPGATPGHAPHGCSAAGLPLVGVRCVPRPPPSLACAGPTAHSCRRGQEVSLPRTLAALGQALSRLWARH